MPCGLKEDVRWRQLGPAVPHRENREWSFSDNANEQAFPLRWVLEKLRLLFLEIPLRQSGPQCPVRLLHRISAVNKKQEVMPSCLSDRSIRPFPEMDGGRQSCRACSKDAASGS